MEEERLSIILLLNIDSNNVQNIIESMILTSHSDAIFVTAYFQLDPSLDASHLRITNTTY